jgi:hypothetical protein
MVLKLKQQGIPAPLAAKIATYAERSLRTVTQNLGWDWQFLPSNGKFDTEHEYRVEVADLRYIRFGSDANPSHDGTLEYFDWHEITKPGVPIKDLRPCVVIGLDLSQVARLLAGAFRQRDRA